MKKVILLALLLLVVTPAKTEGLGPSAAQAAECRWERHAKRVVKHVRRHGKIRKVVRRRHWWTCAAQAEGPAASAPAPATPAAPEPEPEPEANRLAVKGAEYYLVLSRPSVKAGSVTIELNNQGEDPHNLNLRPEGSSEEPQQIAETDSLQHTTATFDLAPGKYRLWCSLPGHEEKGMTTSLVVVE